MKEKNTILARNIVLAEVDHTKQNITEVLEISKEELRMCIAEIRSKNSTPRELLDSLGLENDEIVQKIDELLAADRFIVSRVIVALWKERGKKQISLQEYIGTAMLIWTLINTYEKEGLEKKITIPNQRSLQCGFD